MKFIFSISIVVLFVKCKSEIHGQSCNCKLDVVLSETSAFINMSNGFYKSKSGHLYNRTSALVGETLEFKEYLNGNIYQNVDGETFEQIETVGMQKTRTMFIITDLCMVEW